ncbi:MAG: biotin--[acetyl-CoA-carboxylase] ligase, partial [Bryobacteraceae bacterium]
MAKRIIRRSRTRCSISAAAWPTDSELDSLLAVLAGSPMIVISGQRIAREIGVTRSTVWRWIVRLRGLGVKVKGHPRSGYHIEKIPDVLLPGLLRERLVGSAFGKRIHHFFKTDSTNRVALELGQAGEPHGAIVIAEEQTAGRGRVGRAWHSERSSGLYLSLLLRPQLIPAQAPMLTLVAGLAVRDAVEEVQGGDGAQGAVDLRWPNDVLIGGKKISGVLTEMYAEPDRVKFVVCGIGINVNHTKLPAEISGIATSLRMAGGRQQSRIEVVVRLLRHFEGYYNQFLRDGAGPIVKRFGEVSSFARGKRIRVTSGQETFPAVTAGLDPSGLLIVTRENGSKELLLSADISEA